MTMGASAPGKLILCGEYAVLEGAPAVVTAVNRRVHATWAKPEAATLLSPEAAAARALAQKACGAVPDALEINVSHLQRDGKKLGLGSSGAGAAAAAAAVLAWHGRDLTSPSVVRQVFEFALAGHHEVAPQGSGVDVACSTFGGTRTFRRSDHGVTTTPLEWPRGVHASVVWTGHPVRTSDLVAGVRDFQAADPTAFHAHLTQMRELAVKFVDAFTSEDVPKVLHLTTVYANAMQTLGELAGVPIVEERLRTVMEEASSHEGAAKPSGAGGGDIAVAFFPESRLVGQFERRCETLGMPPLRLVLGVPGVQPLPDKP